VTLRGSYAVNIQATSAGQLGYDGISFIFTLPAAISAANVHFVGQASTPPSECPGSTGDPEAQPGNLCLYENTGSGYSSVTAYTTVSHNNVGASPLGFEVRLTASGAGSDSSDGTWALTT
jgi:hypothetical protein